MNRDPNTRTERGTVLRVVRRDDPESNASGSDRPGAAGDARTSDNLFVRLWRALRDNDAFTLAGGMAYFAFLSLPPAILLLFAVAGLLGGEELADWLTEELTGVLPEQAAGWIDAFVEGVVRGQAPGPLSISLLVAIWASSNVFAAVIRALNIAYGVDETRGFIKQRAIAIGVMILFVALFLAASAALLMGPQIVNAIELFGAEDLGWRVAQWALPILLVIAAFALAYGLLPARHQLRHWREVMIGAVAATVIWVAATAGFRFYIANFGNYEEFYGVLGGILILLLWLYLTMLVLLIGGQIAAELERETAK